MAERKRTPTTTSTFGSGAREAHDATPFYARFSLPAVSDDETISPCAARDTLVCGDARDMSLVGTNSVALVVTSPPYFAGKAYETAMGEGGVPASYLDYLAMLHQVFRECARVLEPGGRMAVNVANLGRKPFRSLASDVIRILQDELGMLLRGEIVWMKGEGATGSCAWGSFASASNPCLRDLTERVILASKGRFDRAIPKKKRAKLGLPHEDTIERQEFMESTLDVWKIRPESARKVGHPAPFPVELPARLIRLNTYKGDVVLDPFLGSGSTAVAAAQNERSFVGFDTDPNYVRLAAQRLKTEAGNPAVRLLGVTEPVFSLKP